MLRMDLRGEPVRLGRTWKTEETIRKNASGQLLTPQRLRLRFAYGKLKRESVITLNVPTEGLPNF